MGEGVAPRSVSSRDRDRRLRTRGWAVLGRRPCLRKLARLVVGERFCLRIPKNLFSGEVRLSGHHASDGVCETSVYRCVRLLARAHAIEPVTHVFETEIVNAHGGDAFFPRQRDESRFSLSVDVSIIFVRAFFLNQLKPGRTFASD